MRENVGAGIKTRGEVVGVGGIEVGVKAGAECGDWGKN